MMSLDNALENSQLRNWTVASLGLKYLNDGLYDFVHHHHTPHRHGQSETNMLDLCISHEPIRQGIEHIDNFERVQNIQNDILQNARFTLTDAQVIYYLSQMIAVLKDGSLASNEEAQEYLCFLSKLHKDHRDGRRKRNSRNPVEERLERLEAKFESEKSRDADARELIRLKNMINANQQPTNNDTVRPTEPRSYQACRHAECLRHIHQQQNSVVQYAKRQRFEIGQIWPDDSWRCQQSHPTHAIRTHRCSACTVIIEGDHNTCENCGKVYCKECFTLRDSQRSVAKHVNKNDCHICSKLVERLSSFEVQQPKSSYMNGFNSLYDGSFPTDSRWTEQQLDNGSLLISNTRKALEEDNKKQMQTMNDMLKNFPKGSECVAAMLRTCNATSGKLTKENFQLVSKNESSTTEIIKNIQELNPNSDGQEYRTNAENDFWEHLLQLDNETGSKTTSERFDETAFSNSQSLDGEGGKGKTIKQRILPPFAWPVYNFSCKHTNSLSAHYRDLLTKCSMEEEKVMQLCKERLHKNICLKMIGNADMFVGSAIEKRKIRGQGNIPMCDKVPVSVFVAAIGDADLVARLCAANPVECPEKLVALIKDADSASGLSDEEIHQFSEGTRFCVTTVETLLHDIDELLEQFVFDIVKVVTGVVQQLQSVNVESDVSSLNRLSENISVTQDPTTTIRLLKDHHNKMVEILAKTEGMYRKSGILSSEQPDFSPTPDPPIDEETLLSVLAGEWVIGCGESYGVLHVFIDDDIDDTKKKETHDKITYILSNKGHKKYAFKYVSKHIKAFLSCGATVGNPSGTLGGFAMKTVGDDHNSGELCALISGHVSKFQQYGILTDGEIELGHILKPLWEDGGNNLDIAAVQMFSAHVSECITYFKDEQGNDMRCKLVNFDACESLEIPDMVHIWGATSKPGLGEILIHKYNLNEDGQSSFMILTERADAPENVLCKEGDSGAIICADDRCGEFVHVLAMIVGKIQQREGPNQYLAVQLHAGLENLKTRHGVTFTLYNQFQN